jgi:hypothetical protein
MLNTESETIGLKPIDLSYCAGYLDGEGCFTYHKTPQISIESTYPHTLYVFKEMFGGNVKKRSKRANKASRSSYIWAVYGEDAISLIKIILKYLHEKHQQAVILLKIQGYPPHSFMRKHLLNELKKLKRIDYE